MITDCRCAIRLRRWGAWTARGEPWRSCCPYVPGVLAAAGAHELPIPHRLGARRARICWRRRAPDRVPATGSRSGRNRDRRRGTGRAGQALLDAGVRRGRRRRRTPGARDPGRAFPALRYAPTPGGRAGLAQAGPEHSRRITPAPIDDLASYDQPNAAFLCFLPHLRANATVDIRRRWSDRRRLWNLQIHNAPKMPQMQSYIDNKDKHLLLQKVRLFGKPRLTP